MVKERVVDRRTLADEYPGINPVLADRVLTSMGRMGKLGMLQLEREFQGYTGFRLLIDAYFKRKDAGDGALAALALETAERMADSLSGKERETAQEALERLFPFGHNGNPAVEKAEAAVAPEGSGARIQSDTVRSAVGEEGQNKPESHPVWGLFLGFERLAEAGSRAEAEKILGRALGLIKRMDGSEAQRAISEIENVIGYQAAAAALFRIAQEENRLEVVAKAKAHFFYCLPEIGGDALKIANVLKGCLDEPEAREVVGMLLEGREWDAKSLLLEKYPKIGAGHALALLDAPPEYARDKIESIKEILLEKGGSSALVKLMGMLDLESTENCQRNLATVIVESLNEADYATMGNALEHFGMVSLGNVVGLLEFIITENSAKKHVKEAAARMLGLTGQEDAVDVAENCLRMWERGDEAVRSAAYHSLCRLFYLDEARIESIIAIGARNESEDPGIRLELIRWLGENGGGMGVTALQKVGGGCENEKLMLAATKALEKIGEKNARMSLPVPGRRGSRPTISVVPSGGEMLARPAVRITPIKKISRAPPRNSSIF